MRGTAALPGLISVADALRRILIGAVPLDTEAVSLADGGGRYLAEPLIAKRSQPPFPASAMDGYAVRAADTIQGTARLKIVGEAMAGRRFAGTLKAGEAVRIFTGAPVPDGADCIALQENVRREGDIAIVAETIAPLRYIRKVGLDFAEGEVLAEPGTRLDARLLGLAAASNNPRLQVARRPSLGILATGDELVRPGAPAGADQIYLSNSYAIGHLAGQAGARISDFGIAADKRDDLARALGTAVDQGIDVLVTIGGVSVGDHDLVGPTLAALGFDLAFWRIAMRPGKPLMFGRLRQAHVVGLPGNPVSSYVCAHLFLVPLLRALQGDPKAGEDPTFPARLGADMEENDNREDYIRAELSRTEEGSLVATPYSRQDSSMTRVLAKSQVLIVRPPYAAAAKAGDACRVVLLPA